MPQITQDLITQYVSAIRDIYGNHIKQIILYGSYARGDFHKDSDVDIMVLVDLPDAQIESYSDAVSELGFEYNVKHGIWFMPTVKNAQHFRQWCAVYPFYFNVVKEGVMLYETAHLLLGAEQYRGANNRAYYSFYHTIDAVLSIEGIAFKRHKDTLAYFNRQYIATEIFPREMGRRIVKAEEIRHVSDYDAFYIASKEVTLQQVETAEQLFRLAQKYYDENIADN